MTIVYPGVFVSFEEPIEDLVTNFASLGFDPRSLAARKKLALEYVAKAAKARHIAAVNMSLGGGRMWTEPCDNDPRAGAHVTAADSPPNPPRSWSCGWCKSGAKPHKGNHNSKIGEG